MSGGAGRRMAAWLCGGLLLAASAMAGCGGGEDESAAKKKTRYSAATETPKTFVERVAKLLETTTKKADCPQLEEINSRSLSRFACPPGKDLRRSMASFEALGAEAYGTGAVVDYKSGKVKDGAAIVMFVAPNREWGIGRFGVVTPPSTEADDDDSRAGYEETLDDYLAAVRERDCKAFRDVAFTDAKGKEVCETTFAATEDLARRLRANPSAEPEYEGGNASYGFFTLETQRPKPENSTISIVKSGKGSTASYVVLDVGPSPTAADQRRVLEQFEEQQRRGDRPDMSPSPTQ